MERVEVVVVASVPGVQRFIAAGRKTRDVWAASEIVSAVARQMAQAAEDAPSAELVIPVSPTATSVPNRVVVRCHDLQAAQECGRAICTAGQRAWQEVCGADDAVARARMPIMWVAAAGDTYAEAWHAAQEALVRRRRIRQFPALVERSVGAERGDICTTCGMQRSAMRQNGDPLCTTCAAKRRFRAEQGAERFPSTSDVASAPFRDASMTQAPDLLGDLWDAVQGLRALGVAVPGLADGTIPGMANGPAVARQLSGQWLYVDGWEPTTAARSLDLEGPPEGWTEACARGSAAAAALSGEMAGRGHSLSPYYAIVVQDGDKMGRILSSPEMLVDPAAHRSVSGQLAEAADLQRRIIERHLGRVVYVGGDDLLAFVPLASAIDVARGAAGAFADALAGQVRATASVGVAVVHRSMPLQDAMAAAHGALAGAKAAGRDRTCVVAVRRGGERARATVENRDLEAFAALQASFASHDNDDLARRFPSKLRAALAEAASTQQVPSAPLPPGFVEAEVRRILDGTDTAVRLDDVRPFISASINDTCDRFDTLRVLATECS